MGLQLLRQKMQPLALAMGFCARPQLLNPCPHANAESQARGYVRQIQGIERDEAVLMNLIKSLEDGNG